MSSLNRAQIIGNLGRDPEVKQMRNGNPVVNLSVATTEKWKDRNSGEWKEKTEWHRVTVFAEAFVKFAEDYLRKGSKVFIEGKIQTRKWQDQSGQDKFSTEIVVEQFGGKLLGLDGKQERRGPEPGSSGAEAYSGGGFGGDLDDDLPF